MIPKISASTVYSTLGNSNSLVPMAIKDIANSLGLTAGSYVTGDSLEGKDRFLDEFGTQAIWLFGIPVYKKLMDFSLYKMLKIDPKFDVRNLSNKREKILQKSLEYADSSIKGSIEKAIKNPKFSKNLALTKFIASTALAIVSYAGLTKYRHIQTKKAAEKEILAEAKQNKKKNYSFTNPKSKVFEKFNLNKQKKQSDKPTFTGGIQDFMFNPVKNLMILDGAITTERLAESRNKQELIGYTIKEGTVWAFMYFASQPIQKYLEKSVENNKKNPASIDLDARIIESEELKNAFINGELKNSTAKVLKLESGEELLEYIHKNPDDFVVKMAKKSDIIPVLKNANQKDNVDYRKFIDLDEFKGVAKKLEKLSNKFEDYKSLKLENANLDDFLKTVKKLKRSSILKNMGACIGALGILAPVIMIAMRKLDKNNNAFQVKEDLKKELAAKGQI